METPSETESSAQLTSDASGLKETHHADDTHVEDGNEEALVRVDNTEDLNSSPPRNGTEQPLVRSATGEDFQSFPLLRLPPELRTMILEMALHSPTGICIDGPAAVHSSSMKHGKELEYGYVFFDPADSHKRKVYKHTCTKTLWVIDLLTTCRQIRLETKKVLSSNDIDVHCVEFDKIRGRQSALSRTIPLIRTVSSFIGKSSGRIVLWESWSGHGSAIYESQRRSGLPPAPRIAGLDTELSTYAQAVQPFQVSIGLSMTFHDISGFRDVCLCKRDAPVMVYDCRRIQCIIPLGDRVKAKKLVDEAIDGRLALLRRHFPHKWCYVRAMRSKLESGLVAARQYMREEVDRIC